jgi:hypothetical protein
VCSLTGVRSDGAFEADKVGTPTNGRAKNHYNYWKIWNRCYYSVLSEEGRRELRIIEDN